MLIVWTMTPNSKFSWTWPCQESFNFWRVFDWSEASQREKTGQSWPKQNCHWLAGQWHIGGPYSLCWMENGSVKCPSGSWSNPLQASSLRSFFAFCSAFSSASPGSSIRHDLHPRNLHLLHPLNPSLGTTPLGAARWGWRGWQGLVFEAALEADGFFITGCSPRPGSSSSVFPVSFAFRLALFFATASGLSPPAFRAAGRLILFMEVGTCFFRAAGLFISATTWSNPSPSLSSLLSSPESTLASSSDSWWVNAPSHSLLEAAPGPVHAADRGQKSPGSLPEAMVWWIKGNRSPQVWASQWLQWDNDRQWQREHNLSNEHAINPSTDHCSRWTSKTVNDFNSKNTQTLQMMKWFDKLYRFHLCRIHPNATWCSLASGKTQWTTSDLRYPSSQQEEASYRWCIFWRN